MKTKNRSNLIWLKKKHSHPGDGKAPQKASEKYRNHSFVPSTANLPRRTRKGA